MTSYHDAAEHKKAPELVAALRGGATLALVSDAGTPLVSDPGYRLVRAALDAGVPVVPIPGASAVTALLSVAGFAIDRFVFEGFLPQREGRRRRRLEALRGERRTIVVYESPHHVLRTLGEIEEVPATARRWWDAGDQALRGDRPREDLRLRSEMSHGRRACARSRSLGRQRRRLSRVTIPRRIAGDCPPTIRRSSLLTEADLAKLRRHHAKDVVGSQSVMTGISGRAADGRQQFTCRADQRLLR
jgi:hypothetical protein